MPPLTFREIEDPRLRGWLIRERVRCGNAGCRCSTARPRRHGPYIYLHYPLYDPMQGVWRRKKAYVRKAEVPKLRRAIQRAKTAVRQEQQRVRTLHQQAQVAMRVLDQMWRSGELRWDEW